MEKPLINELSVMLSKCKEDINAKMKVINTKNFIIALINGQDVSVYKKYLFDNKDEIQFKSGMQMDDYELLLSVLQRCDEETLLQLETEFGANSRITKIIKEDIRGITPEKNTENIETRLEDMLKESKTYDNPLYSLVCQRMTEKGYETDADFYNSISMSRQNFARIRDTKRNIGKPTVLWIIVGLRLDYIEAREMLEVAGYSFKKNDKIDIVVSQIIKNVPEYDFDMVNSTLDHFGLRVFGAE